MDLLQELLLLVAAELSALDLKNTSLVSQSWRTASQRQLFRVINADLSVFDGRPLYHRLLASPHLIPYIRTVSIYGTPIVIGEDGTPAEQLSKRQDAQVMLAAALKLMTYLETLQIYLSGERFSWSNINPALRKAVEDAFKLPTLRTLKLDEWYFKHTKRSENVFVLLSHSAPALRRLELVKPSCAKYNFTSQVTFDAAKPNDNPRTQLEELSIIFTSLPPVEVSNWVLNQLRAFDLTDLRFLHTSAGSVPYDNSYLAVLLGLCHTSLKSFHLELSYIPYTRHESGVDLSSLSALRTLTLQIPVTERNLSFLYPKWLKATLESFRRSPNGSGSGVEHLNLWLSVASETYNKYDKSSEFGYKNLAMLLNDQQCFPKLKRVRIELRGNSSERLPKAKVLNKASENMRDKMGDFLGDRLSIYLH